MTDNTVFTGSSPLTGLKLLIALDTLLVESSIGRAAERLGMSAPAMSRLLGQIREQFGDPIFIRTGRGMVPTPFAESLRARLRALVDEADSILSMKPSGFEVDGTVVSSPAPVSLPQRAAAANPPLAMRRHAMPEGVPSPETISRRLDEMARSNDPSKRLARYIITTGAGAGRTRPLTLDEAEDAMSIIMEGEADPIQIGALLIALQYRGVTSPELAGLAKAIRRQTGCHSIGSGQADLDWPVYVSPRRGSPPWFLLAARLVARTGQRVLLHGPGSANPQLESVLQILGIRVASDMTEAARFLQSNGITYLPLPRISAQLQGLLGLYHHFQMRSPLNSVVHLLNPLGARTSLLSAPGTAPAEILREGARMMGARNLTILTTCRDAAQATPFRAMPLLRLQNGKPADIVIPSLRKPPVGKLPGLTTLEYLEAIWNGTERDEATVEIVLSTVTLALHALDKHPNWVEAHEEAERLWKERRRP